ncbi:MAG TPA: hypothetical protein PLA94_17060 [Myxococcota bacterium]|nr:hypothetical protein [Myxococcota bacterium]
MTLTAIQELVDRLMQQLLGGDTPTLRALRTQYDAASIREVSHTGVGLFVYFHIPQDIPRIEPADIMGGCADIEMLGVELGATCLLFVRGGHLHSLEVANYDEPWPEQVSVLGIRNVTPIGASIG